MGSFRAYLKFGNIKGEVKEPAYRFWIKLLSWDFKGNKGGRADGEITFTKHQDCTSVQLYQYCSDGRTADAVLDVVRDSGGVFERLKMPHAGITSCSLFGSHGDESITESVSISCERIDLEIEPGTPPP